MARLIKLICAAGLVCSLLACEAQKQLELGQAASLAGNYAQAERHYRQALEANPKLAADPLFVAALQRAQAQALHEQARQLEAQHKWTDALERYRAAAAADATFEPAQQDAAQVSTRAADWYVAQAAGSEKRNELNGAIAFLDKAVSFQPDHPQAGPTLQRLQNLRRERQEQADQFFAQAQQQAGAKHWDAALAAAGRAIKLLPDHAKYTRQRATLQQDAARDCIAQGRQLLKESQLDAAERQFNLAMKYVPQHADALRGLGDADYQRGQQAQQQQNFGRALLWYRQALRHRTDSRYQQALAVAQKQVLQNHLVTLTIHGNGQAQTLAAKVLADFHRQRPSYVQLLDPAQAELADYRVDLHLTRLSFRDELQSSQAAQHRYQVQIEIPNPRLPELREKLVDAVHDRDELLRRRGVHCPRCEGRGWMKCADCANERKSCPTCSGTGRRYRITDAQVRRAEDCINELRRDLAREPARVRAVEERQWPYTVHQYARVGALEASLVLSDVRTGVVLETQAVKSHSAAQDTTITGANAELGLAEDPLVLPNESALAAELLGDASPQAAQRLVRLVAAQSSAALTAAARQASGAAALELQVAAALMLEPADAAQSARMLDQLR